MTDPFDEPADPAWPERLRAAWQSRQQADRKAAALYREVRKNPDVMEAWPGQTPAGITWWNAFEAMYEAEGAEEELAEAWDEWYSGPGMSAGLEDPEAGS